MSRILFLIWVLVFFSSCKSKVDKTMEGSWSIDTIIYKQYEIRNCLSINFISFEEIFCSLPITRERCEGLIEYVEEGQWEVAGTDSMALLLKIKTGNMIFSGVHQMTFKRDDQNRLLKMELRSDSLYVVCRKGLFDYDRNQDLVNELVKMSH